MSVGLTAAAFTAEIPGARPGRRDKQLRLGVRPAQRCSERDTGVRALGQPLKSFRDRRVDFTVYDRSRFSGRYLESLGPLAKPQLRSGGYVMNDNAEPDFLEFVRDPMNGFLAVTLPLKGGTELCVKVA